MAVCLILSSALALRPIPAFSLAVDAEFTVLSTLTQIGIQDGVVGFSFNASITNVGATNLISGDENPIPWGYPVIETKDGDKDPLHADQYSKPLGETATDSNGIPDIEDLDFGSAMTPSNSNGTAEAA